MKYRYAKVRGIVVSYGGDSQYPHAGQETGCEWFPSMKKSRRCSHDSFFYLSTR